jgi:hypothetical protein
MALVLNGNRLLAGPAQHRNGASALVFERTSFQRGGPIRNFHLGEATGTASDRAGFPNGAEGSETWSMSRRGGGLAAYTTIAGAGALTASDLQPIFEIAGSMAGSGDLAGAMSLLSGMSATLAGSGNLAGALQALSNMAASIGGSGDLAAALGLLVSIQAVVSGSGGLNNSNLTGFANMSASILSYGELTPEGLRDAVWSAAAAAYNTAGTMGEKLNDAGSGSNPWTEVIEAGYSAADVLRLISAVLLGNATGLESGAQVFTGLDGTTERVTGTYTDGERTITDLDAAA